MSDESLEELARRRVEQGRRLRMRLTVFALGMLVLTPVWAVGEYLSSGSPERLSPNGNAGDWSPWIIWVALVWGFYILLSVVVTYFNRPVSDAEIDRELQRLSAR
jgi:uncharacterized RDD family membrane protein YckC